MSRIVVLAALVAAVGGGFADAGDVIAAPLDAAGIDQMQSASLLGGQRVAPGDVLLANDYFQVVVFAQAQPNDRGRVGRILFLSPTASQETFVFESGPINDWEQGELGRGSEVAVVRFQRKAQDWSAELVVQMPEKTSWVEVTTTIRNTGQNALEIPLVDVVRGPSYARLADDQKGFVAIGKVDAATLAVLRPNGGLSAAQSARGEWFLGSPSTDPKPNALSKVGKRIFRMGKSDAAAPISADDNWSGELKDKKNWHRIPAGATRTMHRRLVFGANGAAVRPMLAAAGRSPVPVVQFVPAGKEQVAQGGKSIFDRARSMVRRTPAEPPPPTATPVPTPSTTVVAKPQPIIATQQPAKPIETSSTTVKVKPVDDLPKVINDSINQIGDLPPPIK